MFVSYEIWADWGGVNYYEHCEQSVMAENPQSASEIFLSNWSKNPNGNLNQNIYSIVVVEANKDPNDYANQLLVIRNY